ncbi:MAG: N-acetylmuramoyl-L-alanine amidase [Bacteroidales bacterium]|nr:N-acetylmuramoyl-L-alanine amidase [Bacteroidales bacterium]
MDTGIKNDKLHTINIYSIKLFFIFLVLTIYSVSAATVKDQKKWVIVIDAGHGGRDSGAQGAISFEKNIALAIALKTGEYLEQNLNNVTVLYTRKNDTFVELQDRASFANKNKADLFISIHANWGKTKNIRGTETFIMGLAKDEQNLQVAMKENEVIMLENDYSTKYEGFDPKSPESYIMFTLMQNIYQEQSTSLASKIQTEYKEKIKRIDRGVKQAGFLVLFMTTMPSVLTETGFITSPEEEKFLNSKQGQDFIASSIFRACREYVNELDNKSGISAVKEQNTVPNQNTVKPDALPSAEIQFMIQVAASASQTEIKPENFKGLTDVIELNSADRFKYASGRFAEYNDAVKYRKKLAAIYPDAFVIAVKENKILPLQQALEQKKKKTKDISK